MMKAWVNEYNHTECKTLIQTRYGRSLRGLEAGVTNGIVCAKSRNKLANTNEINTCQGLIKVQFKNSSLKHFIFPGDSGSALQILPNDEIYYVYGVTSFGVSCKSEELPSFYTRVSSYLYWIETIVWP